MTYLLVYVAMSVIFTLVATIMLVCIFFVDSDSFTHHCNQCGKQLPRFHKGTCEQCETQSGGF